MRPSLLSLAFLALTVAGCVTAPVESVNNYAQFFTREAGVTPASIAEMRAGSASATVPPQVIPVPRWSADMAATYARQGFVLIGSSSFTSGRPEPDQDAIELGVEVGADLIVILNPEYQGTVTASVPMTTPTTTTSYTNGSATAYGPGAPVTAYGSATTTTYGTTTTYVPMTVQRSAYGAGYFVKWRYRFGARYRDLTDGERQQFQTNRGAYVGTVVDNTPAYNSDILPGDVIVAVNGQVPSGAAGLTDLINANRGQTVDVTLLRAGRTIAKRVSILE
jgi:hypothetical protein